MTGRSDDPRTEALWRVVGATFVPRRVLVPVSPDAAVVPARDGGYCLLALRRTEPEVFRSISWSTDAVLAQTRQRLRERGLTFTELATEEDVDDGASWQRARLAFPHLDVSAP